MDDIESFISGISSTEDKSYIDRAREYLSGLNKDELKEFLKSTGMWKDSMQMPKKLQRAADPMEPRQ